MLSNKNLFFLKRELKLLLSSKFIIFIKYRISIKLNEPNMNKETKKTSEFVIK